jgi:hypothetical protein
MSETNFRGGGWAQVEDQFPQSMPPLHNFSTHYIDHIDPQKLGGHVHLDILYLLRS